ncbi:MAG: GGDEF domain-containing protein [Methylocystis sp.]|nr:GGDEF domain-containing protein [Methylocystis sp.]
MLKIIDSVGDLTDLRDKDALEITLATVMFELLDASTLILWRLVRHLGDIGLLQRVRLQSRGADNRAGEPFADATDLLLLKSRADLQACYDAKLSSRRPHDESGMWSHVFPVTDARDVICLLEILTQSPLCHDQERLVFGMLRIYRNHLGILDYGDCDELTGLLNRRTFDESFRRLAAPETVESDKIDPAADRRRPICLETRAHLAVADVDFFKRVNDQFGHPYGDEVLVLLAGLMRECFRETDRLFRFGGEEFLVLLPDTAAREAEQAFERFRAMVEAFEFPQVGRVTMSVGFTSVVAGDTGSNAFGRADEALYVAKHRGRNQVQSYEKLIGAGVLQRAPTVGQDAEFF